MQLECFLSLKYVTLMCINWCQEQELSKLIILLETFTNFVIITLINILIIPTSCSIPTSAIHGAPKLKLCVWISI